MYNKGGDKMINNDWIDKIKRLGEAGNKWKWLIEVLVKILL